MLTTTTLDSAADIHDQAIVTHVCRPTGRGGRHPGDKPPTMGRTPTGNAAPPANSRTRLYRCAADGCGTACRLGDEDPLPDGWCTETTAGKTGAGTVRYRCPIHSPFRPPAYGAMRRAKRAQKEN